MSPDVMKKKTGMIIPVWYPETMPQNDMRKTLQPCVEEADAFCMPENLLVVTDGAPHVLSAVEGLFADLKNFKILALGTNLGKGGAVAEGLCELMKNPELDFFVTRDHDNDHLANDSLNLVRLASHMRGELGHDRLMVIGRRSSIHRHLGIVRGEFEVMMNEFAFDAARYAAALAGLAFNTQYFSAYELTPDMQTGFKCYTRRSAELLLKSMNESGNIAPDLDLHRHGAEIPVIIETLLADGVIGEINRVAWENQPMTTYDIKGRIEVKGTVLAWVIERTGIPLDVASRFLANAISGRNMSKEREGLETLLDLANWALAKAAACRGEKHVRLSKVAFSDYF